MTTLPWTRLYPNTRLHYEHSIIDPHVFTMNTELSIHKSSLLPHSHEQGIIHVLLHYEHGTIYPHFFTITTLPRTRHYSCTSSLWTRHYLSIFLHYYHTPTNTALFMYFFTMNTELSIHMSSLLPHSHEHGIIHVFFTMNTALSIHVFTMKAARSIHTSSQCTQHYVRLLYKHGIIHPHIFTFTRYSLRLH